MQKIELQNENCFTYLPKLENNSIDLIIIDPPYEVSRDTNFTSGKPKGKDTDRFRESNTNTNKTTHTLTKSMGGF